MYIVSACLAGINCRYNGKSSENPNIIELIKKGEAIPLCPEQLGGLSTPRTPCEITIDKNGKRIVTTKDGLDVTKEFQIGAEKVLKVAKALSINKAILKSKSPSCGCSHIYDGTFSGNLIEGNGLTAELLIENNIKVITEEELGL
ncbi:DUF523 domain-containing protein [Clostridium cylindrosporum]|uniref:Uncharacterized protein n=1 Tax=Clostridium cylindrosporum DSM 605 TaxID=1121307 RepID=A0A0J8DAG0_CLOCY|nr:DUF523 domain-containing protein [Clostridium cylindrosporum]KMT22837.1 hypothetical protein CLCY_5c00760 [Clostridium cylindrosporum DSM 605]